jgi:hypothetical protein
VTGPGIGRSARPCAPTRAQRGAPLINIQNRFSILSAPLRAEGLALCSQHLGEETHADYVDSFRGRQDTETVTYGQ